jgi:hypothetical protein
MRKKRKLERRKRETQTRFLFFYLNQRGKEVRPGRKFVLGLTCGFRWTFSVGIQFWRVRCGRGRIFNLYLVGEMEFQFLFLGCRFPSASWSLD